MILVTGSTGFVCSNFVIGWINRTGEVSANLPNLAPLKGDRHHTFIHGNVCNREPVAKTFKVDPPKAVVRLAAHSPVDLAISNLEVFGASR